jgi:hypothetical protein
MLQKWQIYPKINTKINLQVNLHRLDRPSRQEIRRVPEVLKMEVIKHVIIS